LDKRRAASAFPLRGDWRGADEGKLEEDSKKALCPQKELKIHDFDTVASGLQMRKRQGVGFWYTAKPSQKTVQGKSRTLWPGGPARRMIETKISFGHNQEEERRSVVDL